MKTLYLQPEQVYTLRTAPQNTFELENMVLKYRETHANDQPPLIIVPTELLSPNIAQSPVLNHLIGYYTRIQNKKGPHFRDYSKLIKELEQLKTSTSLIKDKLYLVEGLTRFVAAGITGYRMRGWLVESDEDLSEIKVKVLQGSLPSFCPMTQSLSDLLSQEGDPFNQKNGKPIFRLRTIKDIVDEVKPKLSSHLKEF